MYPHQAFKTVDSRDEMMSPTLKDIRYKIYLALEVRY